MKSIFFKKFNDIEEINSDFHIHSSFCHGNFSIEQAINKAIEMGLKTIAITSHYEYISNFTTYKNTIIEYGNREDIKVLTGIEVNYEMPFDRNILKNFDIVIGSFHSYPNQKENYFLKEFTVNSDIIYDECFHVLGHAGGQSLKFFKGFPMELLESLIRQCACTGKIFEINYSRHKTIQSELCFLLKKYNPYVSFGSDAHQLADIGVHCKTHGV